MNLNQNVKEVPRINLFEINQATNKFAFDLYKQVQSDKGNLFFSPASIITALAMVYAGARGKTEIELAKALNLTLRQEDLHPAFAKWISELIEDANQSRNQLNIANSLWGRKGFEILPTFLNLLTENYGTELKEIDFDLPSEAAEQINNWVAQQTENKIRDITNPEMFDSLTRLILANAIYFKGAWKSPFEEYDTHDAPFTLEADSSGQTVQVPLMSIEEEINYSEGEDYQAIELPYVGDKFSMIIFLPKKENVSGFKQLFSKRDGENTLEKFEQTFTLENFTGWRPKHTEKVKVYVPKFKVSADLELVTVLRELGITDAFSPDDANFAGISDKEPLYISNALHKAWVEVNEEGTEAAASTIFAVALGLAMTTIPQPKIFRADHPFLFLICRKYTNNILFMGRVMNPLES